MKRLISGLFILTASFAAGLAAAQQSPVAYPSRPIKIVVPFAPGGTTDILARLLGQRLTTVWGQPVVVENKPGAGATLGAELVAKSPADGYTLLMGATHHTIAQNVYPKLTYHLGRDFAPVSVMALVPNMIVVNANVPAKTVQELIALAKSQPGKLNYGSAGLGTAHHLIGEMFKLRTGVNIVHVPYKGSAPAVADLLAGTVEIMFDTVTSGLPHTKSGRTRVLAVTTAKRSSALPDVPALAESALPGFDVGTWFGILAPAGTPPEVVGKLNAEIAKMINEPETRKQLLDMGAEPVGSSSSDMAAQLKRELEAFESLAKQIKLNLD